MRPFGHDGAREGRDAHIAPLDARLLAAWERTKTMTCGRYGEVIDYAYAAMAELRPSPVQLHRLVTETPIHERSDPRFGMFLGACYGSLPDSTIVYPYDTPEVSDLGQCLTNKTLVITGTVGSHAGREMLGDLVIEGTVGTHAGHRMIGSLTNNGDVGDFLASEMIGELTNNAVAEYACFGFMGRVLNNGTMRQALRDFGPEEGWYGLSRTIIDYLAFPFAPEFSAAMRGTSLDRGMPPNPWRKKRFLADIRNPENLDHETLYRKLRKRYRRNA